MPIQTIKVDGGYIVEIERNKSITIRETSTGRTNTFMMGDMAEYGSYNLSYYGPIIGITQKSVGIIDRFDAERKENGEKVKSKRLKLWEFCWRNLKFDLAKTTAQNLETSHHI